jgi:hypothetical protein
MNKFFIFLCAIVFGSISVAHAQTAPLPVPQGFGGRITNLMVCTGNGSLLVGLQDFRTNLPIQLHYIPLVSRLNQNYALFVPGNAVLGTYMPSPQPCLIGFCPFCKPYGKPIGVITSWPLSGVGTSLSPIPAI